MSSITNIASGDLITDSRADINNNFAALNTDKVETSVIDTDTTLAADSDSKLPSQKAVKAYVDAGGNVNATETTKGIVEIATDAEVAAGTATGATGASLVVTPDKLATKLALYTLYEQSEVAAASTLLLNSYTVSSSTTGSSYVEKVQITLPTNLTGSLRLSMVCSFPDVSGADGSLEVRNGVSVLYASGNQAGSQTLTTDINIDSNPSIEIWLTTAGNGGTTSISNVSFFVDRICNPDFDSTVTEV